MKDFNDEMLINLNDALTHIKNYLELCLNNEISEICITNKVNTWEKSLRLSLKINYINPITEEKINKLGIYSICEEIIDYNATVATNLIKLITNKLYTPLINLLNAQNYYIGTNSTIDINHVTTIYCILEELLKIIKILTIDQEYNTKNLNNFYITLNSLTLRSNDI